MQHLSAVYKFTYSLDGSQVQGAAAEDGTVGSAFWVLWGYLQPLHQSLQGQWNTCTAAEADVVA